MKPHENRIIVKLRAVVKETGLSWILCSTRGKTFLFKKGVKGGNKIVETSPLSALLCANVAMWNFYEHGIFELSLTIGSALSS